MTPPQRVPLRCGAKTTAGNRWRITTAGFLDTIDENLKKAAIG
ncbi:hypothetical protein [Microvirga pakistanensis]|nr:hypothetical protein [Microvirga pakistanensis]